MLSAESKRGIKKIIKENKKWTDRFAEWDRTGVDPFAEKLVSFSLKEKNHLKLKKIAHESGKSMSDIVDDLIEKYI